MFSVFVLVVRLLFPPGPRSESTACAEASGLSSGLGFRV